MHCYLLPSEIQKACPPRCCSRLVIKRRKCNVWCAWVCLRSSICGSKQGLLAEKNLLPGWAESIQSIIYHTSPRQKSIATNLPACHTTTRPKEPCNQPAQHGIGDLWRSATQDSTPCIPAQWACHGNVPQRPAQSSLSLLAPRTCGPINPRKTLGFPNNNGHRKFLLVSNTTLQRPYLHVGTHIFPAQAA